MEKLSAEDINKIGLQFLDYKNKYEQKLISKSQYDKTCNVYVNRLSCVVYNKTNKYRKFSNYEDLVQDGFEGLMKSLKSFTPSKGNFVWWVNKYVGTNVSRAACNHSAMRVPIKKAGKMKPFKYSITFSDSLEIFMEKNEITNYTNMNFDDLDSFSKKHIDLLSPSNKVILTELYFGNHKTKDDCEQKICSLLNINKQACVSLISEAESSLKEKIKVSLGIL